MILLFLRSNWRILAIAGVVIALVFGLYLKGRSDEHAKNEARRKIDEAAAVKLDTKADSKSTETLVRDAAIIAAKQKELEDAVADQPDSLPSAVAVAAGCRELQQHGISVADLPACGPARR